MLRTMILQADPARHGRPGGASGPAAPRRSGGLPRRDAHLHLLAPPRGCRPSAAASSGLLRCELGPIAQDAIPAIEALLDRRDGRPIEPTWPSRSSASTRPHANTPRSTSWPCSRNAAIDPGDRIHALSPLGVMLKQSNVPERVRDDVHRALRSDPRLNPASIPSSPAGYQRFPPEYQERLRLQSTTERGPAEPASVRPDAAAPVNSDTEPGGTRPRPPGRCRPGDALP